MRLKDFKYDTAYATCDGNRATIVKFEEDGDNPIVRRRFEAIPIFDTRGGKPFTDPDKRPLMWVSDRYNLEHPLQTVYIPEYDVPKVATDPWGKCTTARAQSVAHDTDREMRYIDGKWRYLRLTTSKGIVVDVWTVDEDGEVIDGIEPYRMVYAQKDIPGTWLEYMTLHGEDVKARASREANQRHATDLRREATKRLNTIYGLKMQAPAHADSYVGANRMIKSSEVSMSYLSPENTYDMRIVLRGAAALAYARNTLRLPGLKHATVTNENTITLP